MPGRKNRIEIDLISILLKSKSSSGPSAPRTVKRELPTLPTYRSGDLFCVGWDKAED